MIMKCKNRYLELFYFIEKIYLFVLEKISQNKIYLFELEKINLIFKIFY